MRIIDLEAIRIGIIILCPTGVAYTNQTGGYACNHPQVEGIFAPLPMSEEPLQQIADYFFSGPWKGHCYRRIDAATADFLDTIFRQDSLLSFITVDRDRFDASQEAWIYVNLAEPDGDPQMTVIAGFGACKGILTWENSD